MQIFLNLNMQFLKTAQYLQYYTVNVLLLIRVLFILCCLHFFFFFLPLCESASQSWPKQTTCYFTAGTPEFPHWGTIKVIFIISSSSSPPCVVSIKYLFPQFVHPHKCKSHVTTVEPTLNSWRVSNSHEWILITKFHTVHKTFKPQACPIEHL